MILDTTPALLKRANDVQRKKHQAQSRKELAATLRYFYLWHAEKAMSGDIENLVEQGVDAAEAVLKAYPPFNDLRTLATD